MSEHKDSQEMLRDLEEWSGIHELQSDEFWRRVNEYALSVAREAVEWQKERSRDMTCANGRQNKSTCEALLIRIENRLNQP